MRGIRTRRTVGHAAYATRDSVEETAVPPSLRRALAALPVAALLGLPALAGPPPPVAAPDTVRPAGAALAQPASRAPAAARVAPPPSVRPGSRAVPTPATAAERSLARPWPEAADALSGRGAFLAGSAAQARRQNPIAAVRAAGFEAWQPLDPGGAPPGS